MTRGDQHPMTLHAWARADLICGANHSLMGGLTYASIASWEPHQFKKEGHRTGVPT